MSASLVATAPALSVRRRGRQGTELSRILPLFLLVFLFFDVPLLTALGWSFRDADTSGFTFHHYAEFATSHLYLPVVWRTVLMAVVVTGACALLGYPLALWMSRQSAGRQMVALGLVIMTFWISILVRTYAWIVILGNGGIVNRALRDLGLTDKPISFIYNEFGVAVGMINLLLPYLILPLYAAMLRVDQRLLHVAATLGASERTIFWRIFLPITLPALSAAMVLVFILSLGFYITPAILGGGKVPMISNMLDLLINRLPRWELASAISISLLLVTLLFYGLYQWLRARTPA
jgi:ABC-type spermidine/putrescine transport system permease subunit I